MSKKINLWKILLIATLLSVNTHSSASAAAGWGAPFTVDSTGVVGMYASMMVINGNPAIAYYDATNGDLKYARSSNADGTVWATPVTVQSAGTVGSHLSLAVVNGNPAISYYTGNALMFVRAVDTNGASWENPVIVDNLANVGLYTSLSIINGNPAISYFDLTNSDLKYVRSGDLDGAGWDIPVTVDSSGIVGEYTSLTQVNGRPAISYYDRTNGALKYARASDGFGFAWGAPLTVDTGSVGLYSSLRLVNGNPAISYQDPNTGDDNLKFIRATDADGATWGSPLTLDTGDLGDYSTLCIINGNPAIGYRDSAGLRYIRATDANGTTWALPLTLDAASVSYISLAQVNGVPSVAYHNTTSGDLEFITMDSTPPSVTINQAADQPDPAYVSPVSFDVVFSEAVVGFENNDVMISGMVETPIVSVVNSGDNIHFTVSITGLTDLDHVIATIPAGGISDVAGNPNLDSTSTDNSVFYTTSTPLVVSIVRLNASPTDSSSVSYAVTFTEPVAHVEANDFAFTNNNIGGTSVTAVTGVSGEYSSVYSIMVNTGYGGNGSLRLDVVDDDGIIDNEGNPLGDVGVGNGDFNKGQSYQVTRATFADVPTSFWAWKQIESIYFAQITGGCKTSPLIYCPNNNVTREQMAIFLLRAMYGSSYLPPDAGGSTGFSDVPVTYWAADWIKQLAAEGITGGCGGGKFCPTGNVTRAQMAVFLLRASHGNIYSPPDAGTSTGFSDVPVTYWAADWIKQLAAEGITGGCGSGKFCPETIINRAQMAIFLQKTFNTNMP